jgi:hypothetical protein
MGILPWSWFSKRDMIERISKGKRYHLSLPHSTLFSPQESGSTIKQGQQAHNNYNELLIQYNFPDRMNWYPEDSVDGRAKESSVFNSRNLHNFRSVVSDITHESVLYFIKLIRKTAE